MKQIKNILSDNSVWIYLVFVLATTAAILASTYSYLNNFMLAYGDAESHLNIAKRVTTSLTPGLAQLGGIWLPLPHLLMTPLTHIDILWRTGIAGAAVSGVAFIVAAIFLFRFTRMVTANTFAALVAFLVFILNPNVLYMQSTAMTELPLIAFFILSLYYFIKFLKNDEDVLALIFAAFFGFCATITRYDGWFLVIAEAGLIVFHYLHKLMKVAVARSGKGNINLVVLMKANAIKVWHELEGKTILFATLAFMGMLLWLLWDLLVLGDPLYFTNSPFSAKSQQKGWLARGELATYLDLDLSFIYYSITSYANIGQIISYVALFALILFLFDRSQKQRLAITVLLFVPFIFYVVTLFLGQSVIFIPQLTPGNYEWNLFNVRYGMLMIPAAAFFLGFLAYKLINLTDRLLIRRKSAFLRFLGLLVKPALSLLVLSVIGWQTTRFVQGVERVISLDDGINGLSSADTSAAQGWLKENYDGGLVLIDDYARTMSVIRSGLPMDQVIYIGNRPYWQESLEEPEKHARWIVLQKDDSVWKALYEDEVMQGRLYKYFEKAYTSPEILVFKRIEGVTLTSTE